MSKTNNSDKYTVDKVFCTTPEYFKAMATIHEFLRDVIVNNTTYDVNDANLKIINDRHKKFMKLITNNINDINRLYSIIRLAVVLANNIDIQYTDKNNNETEIMPKLYVYLKHILPLHLDILHLDVLHLDIINEAYKIYDLTSGYYKSSPSDAYTKYIDKIINLDSKSSKRAPRVSPKGPLEPDALSSDSNSRNNS